MTRKSSIRLIVLALFSLAAGLALAATLWPHNSAPDTSRVGPLVGAAVGGPFRLVDQEGSVKTSASFNGRYRLMYFGYTYCPDICPTDVQKMSQGLRLFEAREPARAARVQPIMVTIDPERDTPAVMKQFVRAFHPRLIGLTGGPAEIKATLSRFAIYTSRQGPKGATDYLMDHSAMMYLMGPKGEPISFFARDATPEQIAADLAAYVA